MDLVGREQSGDGIERDLAPLVEMRLACPGRTLRVDELERAGRPGERMTVESGPSGSAASIRTLRAFGLREVLLSRDGGYLLEPDVPIVRN